MIAGLDKPTEGEVIINEADITKLSIDDLASWRAQNVGVIFQSYNLMPYMSALNNVALPLVFRGVRKKARVKKATALLNAVGMKKHLLSSCQILSGGEQQRVTIARALINSPKIILADEPTGDLDTKTADEVMEILYNLYKEGDTTIIMATHNLGYTKFADRILNIKDGLVDCDFKT
jgi:putative ABC transport system ATP-binding protein